MIAQSLLKKDPNDAIPAPRICGTYTSLSTAKAVAHRAIFDAGYLRECFTEFDVREADIPEAKRGKGLAVYAVSNDGTESQVSIATIPNLNGFDGGNDDRLQGELWHVVQVSVDYERDESGEARETNVKGTFRTFAEAWKAAKECLLNDEDGIKKASYADYIEAAQGEGILMRKM